LKDSSGQVELTSSGLGTFEVSFAKRASADGGGVTNPEELIGAAHSACYAMSFAGELGRRGATPLSMEVRTDVTVEVHPDKGLAITTSVLTVRGEADGIDEAGFIEAAEAAKLSCPVSRALAGVDISLDAAMETS